MPLGTVAFPEHIYALGFSWWKRTSVCSCFTGSQVHFISNVGQIPPGATVAVWGQRVLPGMPEGVQVVRLEDGFLRSVGLGADLTRPVSWVLDRTGIYFDATRPSDLEQLLQQTDFSADQLLKRAAALRQRLVDSSLTKYNVGTAVWQRPAAISRVILVPGQVESDASLAYGAPGIKTNMALLQAVRAAHPDAFLVYKPHPDVLAGLRAQGQAEDQANTWCDEQVTDVTMGALLSQVDELHTMTSLAGFEALLRGKRVVCYGQPFYSGWGLTEDMLPVDRRTRRLRLEELIAGSLLLYPCYMSRHTGRLITAEQALDELLAWREQTPVTETVWTRIKRMVLRRVVGVR